MQQEAFPALETATIPLKILVAQLATTPGLAQAIGLHALLEPVTEVPFIVIVLAPTRSFGAFTRKLEI